MRKFKRPVSMFMTKQDIEKGNLIEKLTELGYNCKMLRIVDYLSNDIQILIYTNIKENDVNYSTSSKIDRNHINFTNVDLFVSLAAMSEGEEFYLGEKVKVLGYENDLFTFESSRTGNPFLYHFVKELTQSHIFSIPNIRKATREEIINHFNTKTNTKMEENEQDVLITKFNNDLIKFISSYKDVVLNTEVEIIHPSKYISITINFKPYKKKVTRAEIAKLLNVDEFEIID